MADHYPRAYHGPPTQSFASRPLSSITESAGPRPPTSAASIHYQPSMSPPESLPMWQHMPSRPSNAAMAMMGSTQHQQTNAATMMMYQQGLSYYPPPAKMFSPTMQQQPQNASFYHASLASSKRFSEEEKQKLEKVFTDETQKPSTSRKRQLAEELSCPVPKVNNWFQNRRAREKQMHRVQAYEASQAAGRAASEHETPDALGDGIEVDDDAVDSDSESMDSHRQPKNPSETDGSSPPHEHPTPDSSNGRGCDSVTGSPGCLPGESLPALANDVAQLEFALEQQRAALSQLAQLDVALHDAHFNNPEETLSASPDTFGTSQNKSSFQTMQNHFDPRFTIKNVAGVGVFMEDDAFPTSASFITQRTPTITTSIAEHDDVTGHTSGEHDQGPGFSDYHSLSPDMVPPPSPSADGTDLTRIQGSSQISIASRRKIRPPQRLNQTALRDFQTRPRTGTEDPKRTELYKTMRRAASSTGPLSGKISKSATPVSPRSPRNLGSHRLEQLITRHPSLSAAASRFVGPSGASPGGLTLESRFLSAGNSGLGLQHQSSSRSLNSYADRTSLSPGTSEYKQDASLNHNHNMGLLQHFQNSNFAHDTGCGNISPDEPLATPGLSHFGSELDFSSSLPAPRYVESEPTTPSYVPVPIAASSTGQSQGYPALKIGTPPQVSTFPWSRSLDNFPLWNVAQVDNFADAQSHTFQFQPNITPSNFQPPAGS